MHAVPRSRSPRRALGHAVAAALLALATVSTATAADGVTPGEQQGQDVRAAADSPAKSDFFSTVDVDPAATVGAPAVGDNVNHGDLWPNCWGTDDHVYTAYGDGVGFGGSFSDIGVARVSGMPGSLQGTQLAQGDQVGQVWTPGHTRKPTGMACVDGTLYLAVQDLAHDFNDAPAATIAKSTDRGRTWTWDRGAPMFGDGVFTTVMFLDYGKGYREAPDGYVYAYGLDHNWRDSFDDTVPDPVDLYLARVPRGSVMDRSAWQFVSGFDAAGGPLWSSDISRRAPVLHDDRRVYQDVFTDGRVENTTVLGQGGIVYNKGLDRYVYTSWTEYTFEFYEAPTPWGPWRHFETKDFGGYPWTHTKHGGYATTIPSKYISADGRSMWLQSNVCPCGGGYPPGDHWAYTFSLRKLQLEPYAPTTPGNGPDGQRNLAREPGTVGVERATHFGNGHHYNDGDRTQSEDDWNDQRKGASWWGYTWPREYLVNKVVYTTGKMFGDGGWFARDLRVQVRRDHRWVDVSGLRISPAYPYDVGAGPHRTYTLGFDPVAGDGVRIIGAPGGTRTFTSIAELEVYYAGTAGDRLAGSPTDLDGDGRDDVVTFTQNASGDVYAATSDGSGFGPAEKAHEFFAPHAEQPRVGDVNGDGKDDIVTFTGGTSGDAYAALSDGRGFGASQKWHDGLVSAGEFPYLSDVDGDRRDDVVIFTHTPGADVHTALSDGTAFGGREKWHEFFGLPGETSL